MVRNTLFDCDFEIRENRQNYCLTDSRISQVTKQESSLECLSSLWAAPEVDSYLAKGPKERGFQSLAS